MVRTESVGKMFVQHDPHNWHFDKKPILKRYSDKAQGTCLVGAIGERAEQRVFPLHSLCRWLVSPPAGDYIVSYTSHSWAWLLKHGFPTRQLINLLSSSLAEHKCAIYCSTRVKEIHLSLQIVYIVCELFWMQRVLQKWSDPVLLARHVWNGQLVWRFCWKWGRDFSPRLWRCPWRHSTFALAYVSACVCHGVTGGVLLLQELDPRLDPSQGEQSTHSLRAVQELRYY